VSYKLWACQIDSQSHFEIKMRANRVFNQPEVTDEGYMHIAVMYKNIFFAPLHNDDCKLQLWKGISRRAVMKNDCNANYLICKAKLTAPKHEPQQTAASSDHDESQQFLFTHLSFRVKMLLDYFFAHLDGE
jgi:hypothetical protein